MTVLVVSALVSVSSASANEKLSVAATPVPAAEILEFMTSQMAEQGVDLQVHVFTDFIQPNQQVVEKQIDMNCFQHKPHLDSFNENEGQNLVPQGYTYILPLGAYSTKIKSLVTRKRLYLETMQEVFSNTSKVMLTGDQGQNSLLYLPLDKMLEGRTGTPSRSSTSSTESISTPVDSSIRIGGDSLTRDLRSRGSR